MELLSKRITIDKNIYHGKPTIRGKRINGADHFGIFERGRND